MAKWCCFLVITISQCVFTSFIDYDWPVCPQNVGSKCMSTGTPSSQERSYNVTGHEIFINIANHGVDVTIDCKGATALDSEALPRFAYLKSIGNVYLKDCPGPSRSYALTLSLLNITDVTKLHIINIKTGLRKEHFKNLTLDVLEIYPKSPMIAEPNIFSETKISNLILTDVSIDTLPYGLKKAYVTNTGVRLTEETVKDLVDLRIRDRQAVDVTMLDAAKNLKNLSLQSPVKELPDLSSVEMIMLDSWNVSEPTPMRNCANLTTLTIISRNFTKLPDDWFADCTRLNKISLYLAEIEALSPYVLRGASHLTEISIKRTKLKDLPIKLFNWTRNLTKLDLSFNKLETIPSGIFLKTPNLKYLDLEHNKLNLRVFNALSSLTGLHQLSLSTNPLGPLCETGTASVSVRGKSLLSSMRELRLLKLASAKIPDICDDWLLFPSLTKLDLSKNIIKELRYYDLRPLIEMDLTGNPITKIDYTDADCNNAMNTVGKGDYGRVLIDSRLKCDCNLYHFALSHEKNPNHININSLRCSNGKFLRNVPASELYCEFKAPEGCVSGCTCQWWADRRNTTCNSKFGIRAHCDSKSLPQLYELKMDPNELSITGLQNLSTIKLSKNLHRLDLQNNSLTTISQNLSKTIFSDGRHVLLSANPLSCDCGDRYLIDEIIKHHDQVEDYSKIRCSDGRALIELVPGECSRPPSGALAALAVLAAAVFAATLLAVVLGRPALRLRVKAFLYARGVRVAWLTREEEDDKLYDAFVSFSHHDETFVVRDLVPMLEKEYKLCLHYRDWQVGAWIPEQIAASVRDSRRTIIVVSENYARSDWARAEFREAHAAAMRDATPRLLAVLLQDEVPSLDPELKLYLANNTYVKWGDPAFWNKLRYAMPHRNNNKFGVPAA